jgi:UDP-N-acetylmuramoyl-L-alanyl-D-glutamate--2,6-diaminopimelate ligase
MMISRALSTLLNTIPSQLNDISISGLTLDSRFVKPGDLFFAYQGTNLNGNQFIEDAIQKGAVIVLTDNQKIAEKNYMVPVVFVPHLIKQVGTIAAKFYENPSHKMQVVGITGTNGKTSCSHFIASVLHQLNLSCGVMGTLGNGLYGKIHSGNLTTPDAVTLQKTLAEFLSQGVKHVAMEVSSHSIDQSRINGIDFAIGIFTNLTRDHLDYHGTMENYGNTKKQFFENDATYRAIINADDEFGKKIIAELKNKKQIFAYGTQKNNDNAIPYIYADNMQLDLSGIRIQIESPWGKGELRAGLIGKFNVSNLLAVFTALCLLDIPFETVLQSIAKLSPVAGRVQTFGGDKKPLIVVDYAHTPDALEKVLTALRYHCRGKLYCIFGCGGDRDRGKRPLMAKIAEELADVVIVTDDNPRTENAEQIFSDMFTGFAHSEKVIKEHDRAKAIHNTIQMAESGDCILIAGKGAETYQIIGHEKLPFSDLEQVRGCLAGR